MISKTATIINTQGLHMRPATIFAGEMGKFKSDITLRFDGREINAKSVINLIAAGIKCGSEVEIICDGTDETAALEKAAELIASGLGE